MGVETGVAKKAKKAFTVKVLRLFGLKKVRPPFGQKVGVETGVPTGPQSPTYFWLTPKVLGALGSGGFRSKVHFGVLPQRLQSLWLAKATP